MRVLFLIVMFMNSQNISARTLQLMSYNVENLFDAKHDTFKNADKKDWAFLPKDIPGKKEACLREKNRNHRKACLSSDWTEDKVALKISQIAEVISKDRTLPDFLGLVEVENARVVAQLARKLGYDDFEITESPDERGIDVALLYNNKKNHDIKKISRAEHLVEVDYPTRNILEVEFLINNKYPLTIFVNHWPSLANPDSWRIQAASVLVKRTQEILKKNPEMGIIALGDFNTAEDNNPHPFKTVLFKDSLYLDVNNQTRNQKSPGTYYFAPKDQWNNLDHFFINKVLADGKKLELITNSFEIYAPPFICKEIKVKTYEHEQKNFKLISVPKKFNPKADSKIKMGFSDHFPILVKINYPDSSSKKLKKIN